MPKHHVFVYDLFATDPEKRKIFVLLYKHKNYGMIAQVPLIGATSVSTLRYMTPNPGNQKETKQQVSLGVL